MLPLVTALSLAAADVPSVESSMESKRPTIILRLIAAFPSGGGLAVAGRPHELFEIEGSLSTWLFWSRAFVDAGFVWDVNRRPPRDDWGFVFSVVPQVGYYVDLIAFAGFMHGPHAKLKLELTHFSRGTPGISIALSGGATLALSSPPQAAQTVLPEAAVSFGWAW